MKTFTLSWPGEPSLPRDARFSIGHTLPTRWFLVRTLPIQSAASSAGPFNEHRSSWPLSVIVSADPTPDPVNGPVIGLKNYSENEGLLDRLVQAGVIKLTGVIHKQGFVSVPMVEVLVPSSEQAHQCAGCEGWENDPNYQQHSRLLRCGKCRQTWYCSRNCQVEHWSIHKPICKLLLLGDTFGAENKERQTMSDMFDNIMPGAITVNL